MSVTVWIVLAFLLGFLFGRITSRAGAAAPGAGTIGAGTAPTQPPGGLTMSLPTGFGALGDANGAYRIMLLNSGANKINTIKVIRQITRLGLSDAKNLADSAPREFMRVNDPNQARAIEQAFRGVADVRVDGPAPDAYRSAPPSSGSSI